MKGLVNTIASCPDAVEHRLCVKHLYGNFKKRHAGEHLKEAMWIAARCTTMVEFNKAMENVKKIDEAAWKELNELAPGMWTRAAFSTYTCCDLQVNNMCEAFNSAIIALKELPIISLIDGLKQYITNRIVKLRDFMLRYDGDICPMINKLFDKYKKEAEGWSPNWSGDRDYARFSVSDGSDAYVVNLKEKTCACRKWELTGIPCPHSIACIWYNQQNPDEFVAHWYRLVYFLYLFTIIFCFLGFYSVILLLYRKSTFLDTYDNLILPSNGPKLWPEIDLPPILPPYMRRAPGRPKKQRKRANDEPKKPSASAAASGTQSLVKRNQVTVRCTRCGVLGHNQRTCYGKQAAERKIPAGGNKVYALSISYMLLIHVVWV